MDDYVLDNYIVDDRVDYNELGRMINDMTDEEFEEYCEQLKQK